jgi:putative CocE/NonD family hydrolase
MATFTIETQVMVPMRDGVRLATDIYRPVEGPTPTLLTRTPYDKDAVGFRDDLDLFRALRAGYAVVAQDVRGRFASEGTFDAYHQEASDGTDTIAWIAAQPWSSGVVGTFGKSYLGCTQWLLAPQQPPALRAMASSMTPSDAYEGNTYQGGANVMHVLRWAVGLSADAANRRVAAGGTIPAEWARDLDHDSALAHLPLSDHPAYSELAPFWPRWVSRPADGPYWRTISPNAAYDKVTVPVLNIGGWYDILLGPALENYRGVRHGGGSELAARSRLIIGPWSHTDLTGSFPEREFGPAASRQAIDLDGIQLRWFDRWVKGIDNGIEDEDPVLIFVMGADMWRSEPDWPLPDTVYTDYFLHSDGHANTRRGDGALSTTVPEAEPSDTFVYDPHQPVPSVGGQVLMPGANSIGPRDQAAVEDRDDVLVYTSSVLDEPIEVTGPIRLRLFIASTAPDTDLTGKLVDVFPDGRAINLTDGIQRVRYRNSKEHAELMIPGQVYEVTIDLWATANLFLPGHRIRLEVSSSNWPRFGRNSNTGGSIADEPPEAYQPATNRILHDSGHPSRIVLPVIRDDHHNRAAELPRGR